LSVDSLLWERVYRAVAQKRPRHIRPSSGCCIATALPLHYHEVFVKFDPVRSAVKIKVCCALRSWNTLRSLVNSQVI
jgi:hypothetical protein